MAAAPETLPLYRSLAERLTGAIRAGTLEPGLVLLEGNLSDVFGTSRATVRNALAMLADEGAINRHDGRGFIVAGGKRPQSPIRRRVSVNDFPSDGLSVGETVPASDRIIPEVEDAICTAIAFGHYRVNEQCLATHYGVSRPIIREVLWRLRELGLVEKDLHSPWVVGPLTARAVAEDCEVRALLEPPALRVSAPQLTQGEVAGMVTRIDEAQSAAGRIDPATLDKIEMDLHTSCLKHFTNRRILQVLGKGRGTGMVSGLFARFIGIEADAPELSEHRDILARIAAGDWNAASERHARHLHREGERTLARLKVLSVIQEPPLPDYLERVI